MLSGTLHIDKIDLFKKKYDQIFWVVSFNHNFNYISKSKPSGYYKNQEKVYLNVIKTLPENIKLINTNINNSEKISNVLAEENFDLLLHFAGFIKVEESVQNPDKYFKNNTDNAIKLFETCYKHNLKNII